MHFATKGDSWYRLIESKWNQSLTGDDVFSLNMTPLFSLGGEWATVGTEEAGRLLYCGGGDEDSGEVAGGSPSCILVGDNPPGGPFTVIIHAGSSTSLSTRLSSLQRKIKLFPFYFLINLMIMSTGLRNNILIPFMPSHAIKNYNTQAEKFLNYKYPSLMNNVICACPIGQTLV